ncbi:hypothetical protein AM202_04502, partial [Actinobacillus minor 202]
AQAKKSAQQAVISEEPIAKTETVETDPRKAAVAAALARAKAKKAAQQAVVSEEPIAKTET